MFRGGRSPCSIKPGLSIVLQTLIFVLSELLRLYSCKSVPNGFSGPQLSIDCFENNT